jgi:large subunit ribosomal protein L29
MAKKANDAFKELGAMDEVRLGRELEDTYRRLFTNRRDAATRQLQNVKQIGKTRRQIARIKTLQRQREIGIAKGAR